MSIGVMDRVNDMEFAKKNKSSGVVLDVDASFDKLFPCISMQKLDKSLPIDKYEEYLYAVNDHRKRMNQYIDSKIQIENRRQSGANAESAMNTHTTISQLLSQPQLNQVTPRELERRADPDQDKVKDGDQQWHAATAPRKTPKIKPNVAMIKTKQSMPIPTQTSGNSPHSPALSDQLRQAGY